MIDIEKSKHDGARAELARRYEECIEKINSLSRSIRVANATETLPAIDAAMAEAKAYHAAWEDMGEWEEGHD